MEILADLKLYRKRWAKRITDYAYSMMQVEAQKQLKVDLDKGFQEDIVKKLLKSYQKRNFSKSDLEKYGYKYADTCRLQMLKQVVRKQEKARQSTALHHQSSREGKIKLNGRLNLSLKKGLLKNAINIKVIW